MTHPTHLTLSELEAGLDEIRDSPREEGVLTLIVRRPGIGEREVLQEAELDCEQGLVGDNWRTRGSSRTPDGSFHPDMQINIMNARAIARIAQTPDRWHLAGDQLFIDLDLSAENLPPGTRLELGSAVLEVTNQPHTGCKKFVERFGADALRFVSSPVGKQLNLRGINAKVVQAGVIRAGDLVRKVAMTDWYYLPPYSQERERVGSLEDLIQFLRNGLIADDAYVWTEGMPSWTHADLVPEILERLPLMDPETIAAAYAEAADHDPWPDDQQWAWNKLDRLVRALPERAWPVLLRAIELAPTDTAVDVIAAGPLEDLLCLYGEAFIERIEIQAKADPRFRFALGGVWQNSISEPVWQRVNRITGGPARR